MGWVVGNVCAVERSSLLFEVAVHFVLLSYSI